MTQFKGIQQPARKLKPTSKEIELGSDFLPVPFDKVEWLALDSITVNSRNPRVHSKKQLHALARSIHATGIFVPVVVDDDGALLAGHARLEAARMLGMHAIPVLRACNLTEAQKRVYRLADN